MTNLAVPSPEKPEHFSSTQGVSVVICCHNSSSLLPETLKHLKAQKTDGISWEVVLVDNASSDGTSEIAKQIWHSSPNSPPAPLRVVREPQLGQTFARQRGIDEASYEFLCFVDDDNWVAPDWVQNVWDVMTKHPEAGACGGLSEADVEGATPSWFSQYSYLFAVLTQSQDVGDVSQTRVLWGAGLTLRRTALAELTEKFKFAPVLMGRRGKNLVAGEDAETCLALRAAGWKIWLEPRLRFRHHLPGRRLQWNYLRRLAYASAFATPAHDAIYFAMKPPRRGVLKQARKIRESWYYQLLTAFLGLLCHPFALAGSYVSGREGNANTIQVELRKGRLAGLLAAFSWYGKRRRLLLGSFSHSRSKPVS